MLRTLRMSRNEVALLLILATIVLLAGLGILGQGITRLACKEPASGGVVPPLAPLVFASTSDAARAFGTTSAGCTAPAGTVWAAYAATVLLVVGAAIWAAVAWSRYIASPRYLRSSILRRKEIAGAHEIKRTVGDKTTAARGEQVRPQLWARTKNRVTGPVVKAADVAWNLGTSCAVPVWMCLEDQVLLLGPPRSGKGFAIITSAIMEAPGAVVTTSTRVDNMEATIAGRATRGPVYVFDPERISGRASTLRWSFVAACTDGDAAKRRAWTLVAATGMTGGKNQEWAGKAAAILQCLLHAAAVGQVPLGELHLWTKSPVDAKRALPWLTDHSNLGWGTELSVYLDDDPESRNKVWFGVQLALAALDVPVTRAMFDPPSGTDVFDPATFLTDNGTLYLLAQERPAGQSAGGIGVFLSMLMDDIYDTAHRLSQRAPRGRLDAPMSFVLDELANIDPWEKLPSVMAAGSGEGVNVLAVLQSRSQARAAWGDDQEKTIWESATSKLILGSGSDSTDLRNLSDLLGVREEITHSDSWGQARDTSTSEQVREKPVLSVDELRRLPELTVLLVTRRARPMLVDLIPWPERPWAKHVHRSKAWHQDNPSGTSTHLRPAYTGGNQ